MNATQYTSINTHSYKVIIYMQRLHHFCNIHTLDDGPRYGQKVRGKEVIMEPIPTRYHKIDTAT